MGFELKVAQLQAVCETAKGRAACLAYLQPLNSAMALYGIDTPKRAAMFLAQVAHESGDFTRSTESLYYTDPVRIAKLFKTGFDLNKNSQVDPAEVEFAKGYVRNSEKLANRAYANRNGNGPESSGDGFKYRGRGLIQLTGRENYARCGTGIVLNLLDHPELLEQPGPAATAACWFWKDRKLNAFADAGDLRGATKVINGALTGLENRKAYLDRVTKALA